MSKSDELNKKLWNPPEISLDNVITGDMPGDKVEIGQSHFSRANVIFPQLLSMIESNLNKKIVVSIFGGSGVGKSEIGSLIAHYFKSEGYNSYVLSGDNYPFRIPEENDNERLSRYTKSGISGLKSYLGTEEEIDFPRLNKIIDEFKSGNELINLKRMGRTKDSIFYEDVDFSKTDILVIEWTHGNNKLLKGVDYPVFLFSTPEETLQHRLSRARDKGVDSPFTSLVLKAEQELLNSQISTAAIIINKNSEIISYKTFLEKIGQLNSGVMLNVYPDSCGGDVSSLLNMLKKEDFQGVFSSLYMLPSIFRSDLDRGFSIISYDLNEEYATEKDLKELQELNITLKLDFVLNHLSVRSPQFDDLLKNGDNSKYIDTFIDWNKFWEGKGELSLGGYIVPHEKYLSKLFMRKPGLPILKVPFPDGSYRYYWNTFYQKISLIEPRIEDLTSSLEITNKQAEFIVEKVKSAIKESIPLEDIDFGDINRDLIIPHLEKNNLSYLGQMDLNGESETVWDFYKDTFKKLNSYGAKIVRLDAFAYLHKEIGSTNFFNEPGTWDYLDRIKTIADGYGLTLLPEIHSKYEELIHEKIAQKGYPIYDFFFPGLVIHGIENSDTRYLKKWINEIQEKGFKTVNMLGCHDGIPLLDVKGLLDENEITKLLEIVKGRGGRVKDLFDAEGKKISYYQINATFFSALGEDVKKMLLARAIQIFMPGIPDVWYLDIFAGKNDYIAADTIGHKDINRTNLSMDQIKEGLKTPIVQEQLRLLKFRNTNPAFGFNSKLSIEESGNDLLILKWENGDNSAKLTADLSSYDYIIE